MSITELWLDHSQSRFPKGYGGNDVNGVSVTSVDTYATGCIGSYIGHERKSIDLERYQVLQKCKSELEEVLPYVDGEAFIYFGRLHEMCSAIITEASIA
ncbi:hypothetical protein DU002_09130 [Corallincola holothuriorum]|uniref:Uncharacterized protein n=1 Tax=Corallincola holothuriorum TaxID=2282215 RepID=A0A368NMN7_9GAMM|nr:hypothetical protein DU002_09130 [Corallincola holothuriorum]